MLVEMDGFGVNEGIMEYLDFRGKLYNALIVSPPGCGKTTMLRDLICQLSDGIPEQKFAGVNIGVVDERSELAGCVNGIPQLAIGMRTDVLDGCPKSEGIRMMIRSMGPQAVAADEIGSEADIAALEEALQSGVAILTTAHGNGLQDVLHHPVLKHLVLQGYFTVIASLRWEHGQIAITLERG